MSIQRIALLAAFAPLLLSPTLAAEPRLEITIEAGKHDRINTPIRVNTGLKKGNDFPSILGLKHEKSAFLAQFAAPGLGDADAANDDVILHFVLPSLKAGERATIQYPSPPSAGGGYVISWEHAGDQSTLRAGGPMLTYVHPTLDETSPKTREQTYKPFHHVYSPDGARIITKGPGGRYTHHRGLYFGFNRISYGPDFAEKCDVWHCGGKAHQAHEKVLEETASSIVFGRHRVQIGWHGAKGEKFAEEQRELSAYLDPKQSGQRIIDFASVVRTVDGPIKLDGDPQHAGFHFRADNEVNDKTAKQTYYLRPDGQGAPGETRNWDAKKADPKTVDEPWKVMSFVLGDKRYSVLRIEHPDNPGEHRSSERDYGRFGGYFEYEVTKDAPLRVKYRVIVKDGEFTKEEAERLAADFTDPPKVTVKKLN